MEQSGVAAVRNDVVGHGCIRPAPSLGAFPAEWLSEKLIRPLLSPAVGVVEAVPLRTLASFRPFGLVIRTPTLTGQHMAPRVPTGPHRLVGH